MMQKITMSVLSTSCLLIICTCRILLVAAEQKNPQEKNFNNPIEGNMASDSAHQYDKASSRSGYATENGEANSAKNTQESKTNDPPNSETVTTTPFEDIVNNDQYEEFNDIIDVHDIPKEKTVISYQENGKEEYTRETEVTEAFEVRKEKPQQDRQEYIKEVKNMNAIQNEYDYKENQEHESQEQSHKTSMLQGSIESPHLNKGEYVSEKTNEKDSAVEDFQEKKLNVERQKYETIQDEVVKEDVNLNHWQEADSGQHQQLEDEDTGMKINIKTSVKKPEGQSTTYPGAIKDPVDSRHDDSLEHSEGLEEQGETEYDGPEELFYDSEGHQISTEEAAEIFKDFPDPVDAHGLRLTEIKTIIRKQLNIDSVRHTIINKPDKFGQMKMKVYTQTKTLEAGISTTYNEYIENIPELVDGGKLEGEIIQEHPTKQEVVYFIHKYNYN